MRSITEMMDLSGRCALVTGGAGHVGLAAAESLRELGAAVTILDLDARACAARAKQLLYSRIRGNDGRDGQVFAQPCDLRSEPEIRRAVRSAVRKMGGLDILVHCAAFVGTTQVDGWAVPFERQSVKAWDGAMRVNVTSPFIMVQEARKALAAGRRGSVILIGSTYGIVGPDMRLYEKTSMVNPVGYGASKGGVLQLTRYLSTLLAPKIRVNAISPGGIWRNQPKVFQERYISRTPMGRMAREEDLKGAIAYLAGDLSAYVTGHNLVVDGGWTAW